ncbi:MAG: pyridoxine 4-dehydrogenase [Solirubrobacteraceae bacterium]|nr:pyridoxine 4-dehydrogenase [Solirubrobacteraceae bacterium]
MTAVANLGPHEVRRVGFGAMQLPGPGVYGPPRDRDEALAVLRRAREAGVDHIDTASYYGPDVANELIHEALHPYPEDLRIVSKVGGRRDESKAWIAAISPADIRSQVEADLRVLGAERLTMVNLRLIEPDARVFEAGLATLGELREEGKIELIGLSNVSLAELERGLELADIASVQNQYGLLDRKHEDLLRACAERGLAFVPFFPLGSAFGAAPRPTEDPTVREIAARLGATPAQVALAWLLHHAPNILLIPGTSSLAHLEENLAAGDVELGEDDLRALDGLG